MLNKLVVVSKNGKKQYIAENGSLTYDRTGAKRFSTPTANQILNDLSKPPEIYITIIDD